MSTPFENKMWNIIGAVGWVESGNDYELIERQLLNDYDDNSIGELRAFVDGRLTDLYDRVDEYEVDFGRLGNYSDDNSFGDMMSHVVGMGKLAFDTIMNDPRRLSEIKYSESFLYSIPNDVEHARKQLTIEQ